MKNKFLFYFILLLFFAPNFAIAEKDRGGGDPNEQAFIKSYLDGQKRLNKIAIDQQMTSEDGIFNSNLQKMHRSQFQARLFILKKIKIKFTKRKLYLEGDRKTAINYPSQYIIIVYTPDWSALSKKEKEALAVHEVYGIYNHNVNFQGDFDDSNYALSNWLLD